MRARRRHAFVSRFPAFFQPLAIAAGRRLGALFARMLSPRRPRHPLLKLSFGLIGVALLAVLLVLGVVVGTAMLAAGLIARSLRGGSARRPAQAQTVAAEYRVLRKPQLSAPGR